MTTIERERLEQQIHEHHARGDMRRAVEEAVRGYGPEVLAWLRGVMADEDEASDVFGVLCEDMWRGIAGFQWRSSLRTWMYCLARNAWFRQARSPQMHRAVPLDSAITVLVPHHLRSETAPWIKTEVKNDFTRLRERLAPADRALLTLRVDRRMSWEEVAQIMAEDGQCLSPHQIDRRTTALRQQFQRVKVRLRDMAVTEGLLAGK